MNIIEDKLSTFHQLFQIIFIPALEWFKSSSITSSAWSIIMISMLLLFECITGSSSLPSLEEIKIIVIVNWIFYVSDFLRSFMISFKYGLISLRCCSAGNALFLSPLLLYSI